MSVIVYGTYCNPTPQFGLSFYCQGSTTACNIFRNFTTVSCLSQPSQLYCTNQQTCGGTNFTNDIYIEFPASGAYTAKDSDTVTRANYQFNQTISVAAYSASSAARRSYEESTDLATRATSDQSLTQKVLTTFQNIYNGNATNPTKLLVNSLAKALFSLKITGGAASSTALQNEIRDALFAALTTSANQTVAEAQQCKEVNATADGMLSINKLFIANITKEIPQNSLAAWLLTNFVGHIIANSAVAQELDIIKANIASSSPSACVSPSTSSTASSKTSSTTSSTSSKSSSSSSKTTTTSKSSTTSTSKVSSTSTTSKSSTSNSSKTSTATSSTSKSTTSSSTSKSSTSSKTSTSPASNTTPLAVSSFTTHACPSATPTGSLVYKSNSTQNQALNGSFAMYRGSVAHLQNVLLAPVNASTALYSFPDANTVALTLPDGESLIYTADSSAVTYIQAGCSTALTFYNTTTSHASKRAIRDVQNLKRATPGVSVVMSVTDQCGNPVTSGYALQLDCAEVVYSQTSGSSNPVTEPSTPEAFENTGGGTYTATCDLTDLNSKNSVYNACATQDAQNLDKFCGKELDTVNNAKSYIEKFIEEANNLKILARYVSLLSDVLDKANPALDFWGKMCDKRYGLENPYVQKQFDAEDCGYADALSLGLEGLDANQKPFTSPLGTFAATPTTVHLSTTTSVKSATCCSGATPTSTAADYVYVSNNCTTHSAGLGKSVFCCSGMCLDGTHIGDPGQCVDWLNLCGDAQAGTPSCSANQVLSYGDPPSVDSGDGCCGACCCQCQYQRNNWSYNCCDCPAGYKAVDGGACGGQSNQCVGCSDPRLTLVQSSNGTYSCVCK